MNPKISNESLDLLSLQNGTDVGEKVFAAIRRDFPLRKEILHLRAELVRAKVEQGINSILITALEPGAGSTLLSVALATALVSDKAMRVLLIDGNHMNPQLNRLFHIEIDTVAGLLRGTPARNLKCIPNQNFLRPGNRNFENFMRVIRELESEFDFILVDGAPLADNPETLVLSKYFKGVVIVVEASKSHMGVLEEAVYELKQAKANIFGVILNRKKQILPGLLQQFF